jgi:chromosomal replication initiation ATPase DnaA
MTAQQVLTAVSNYFGIPEFEINNGRKRGVECLAKFTYRWYLYTHLGMGLKAIGRLNGHDHTTIRNSVDQINAWCSVDDEVNGMVSGFVKFVTNNQP